jgi:NAD(P)-dependent dehydrogenase (short-subunit alcohol dehydrogenase family)
MGAMNSSGEALMNTETAVKSSTRIALITGASRGLGRNTAISLAGKGVDLIITYHSNRAEADSCVSEIQALGRKAVALRADTSDVSSFNGLVREIAGALRTTWGRDKLDFLVNNAGTAVYAPFAETREADFDQMVNIHLKGVFFLTQKLLPLIADGGRIVNLSTGLARFTIPGYAAYSSMKGAIEVLTRYLAKELGPRGIAVNTVAPGAIETDFGGGVVRDNAAVNKQLASVTALGRVGVPDDIGPMIASLLSDDNRWITGQRIEVSGGQSI